MYCTYNCIVLLISGLAPIMTHSNPDLAQVIKFTRKGIIDDIHPTIAPGTIYIIYIYI